MERYWCRRAWLARLRVPGQGLDPVAVAAASQPETVWGVPQLQPREQPFDQVRAPCPGQHRSHGVAKDTSSGSGVDSQLLALESIDSGYLWWHHCQEGFRRGFEGHAGKSISRVDLPRSALDVKIELCELRPIFALTRSISRSESRSVDCCR